MTTISAVVRTWNSAATIERTLESIRRQLPTIDEIIVVDSDSVDATLSICRKYDCSIVPYPPDLAFNYAKALNIGISAARGEQLLLISSHVVLCYPDVVQRMSHYILEFGASAVYTTFQAEGRNLPSEADPLRGTLIDVVHIDTFDGLNGLWAPCALIGRGCWISHPFQEALPTCEDQEWAVWHFVNGPKPTVRMRNAGVLYLNWRYTIRKDAFEYAVVAHRILPRLKRWRNIGWLVLRALGSVLLGRWRQGATFAYTAWETARAHFSTAHWHSRMHYPKRIAPPHPASSDSKLT
jgi:glycosyltransferase involved in cell wall biosynthesis